MNPDNSQDKITGKRPSFTPSEFVAIANQSLEYAFPSVVVRGELSSLRVSKNKWVYFDVKDDESRVKCFGAVFQLNTVLEEGMMIELVAKPKLHNLYGFSLNVINVRPVGEGSIKKAADLLRQKLEKEGLFIPERKRFVPRAPEHVGLITSKESAAYVDFTKIMDSRWQGVEVELFDSRVQGEAAIKSIVSGIEFFSQMASPPELIVITRGGGSVDDLGVFSAEPVVRAVASSRVPTVVAIGHEVDISLAEMAADLRASTPSNAAELIFPDKSEELSRLKTISKSLKESLSYSLESRSEHLHASKETLKNRVELLIDLKRDGLNSSRKILESFHPKATLKRGFALVQSNGKLVSSSKKLRSGSDIDLTFADGSVEAEVK